MSVISAAQLLAQNCAFEDTGVGGYTSPAAGVDIEPGAPYEFAKSQSNLHPNCCSKT
eukprot:COSAG03_NODE_890_length_5476_cov_35.296468_2_plen_57_part_00